MLRRLLVLVSAIVLVDVAFFSAITPLLPHYSDELDLTKGEAGVLAGAYAAGTLIAALPAGWIASRIGPRTTVLYGLALLAGACVAFGFAERYELLVGARFVQGVGGAASWAAGMAWLLGVAPRERRGAVIGTALGFAIAGAFGGPVLGAVAEASSPAFVFSAVAVIAAVLAAGVLATPPPPTTEPAAGLRGALAERRVRMGAWLTTLPAVFFGTVNVLTSLRLNHLGVGAAGVAAVFLTAAAAEAVVSPIVGRLADRRGTVLPMRAGVAAMLAGCVVLPLAEQRAWLLAVAVVVALAAAGIIWAPAMAMISEGADAAGVAQGLAFGIVNLAWAGGQVAGNAGGSATAEATSDAFAFAVVAVLAALSLALLLRTPARRTPATTRSSTASATPPDAAPSAAGSSRGRSA
ncbi:MAG TPA: MFS transporter [Solirubrobacteraceae bacterium]|jgi:MFS family permease|nr:MFS transporter [Solirubrobacteraceae bacterium]